MENATASLTISDESANAKGKNYTVYKICFGHQGRSWFIMRRYNEFNAFYEKIKDTYPGVPMKLPGKKLFGNMDSKFVEKRRVGLDSYVQQLLKEPRVLENEVVREFFGLNRYGVPNTPTPTEEGRTMLDTSQVDGNGNAEEVPESEKVNLGPSERPGMKRSDFDYLKIIGKGSFGKVYMAKHKTDGTTYAIKVLPKAQIKKRNEVRHIMAERNVLVKNIQHPFLVGLRFSFQTRDKLYFVLDYANGGELFFHLQREKHFTEPRAKFYAAEIASALAYLHELDIIYRDLKPENLLLDSNGHVVITDFGLCKEGIVGKQTTGTFCGTPEYLAPEVIQKQPYDKTVDWWCLGSVLYEMLFGLPPFYSRDHKEMYDKILHQPLRVSMMVSPAARDILTQMLQKDRHKRIGANRGFAAIKDHAFFLSINWDDLHNKKIKPPFNPQLKSDTDVRYIDTEFTREPIPESVARSVELSASVQGADGDFLGFTYAPSTLHEITE